MSDLPSELRTLVERYGPSVLDDADGLRATLDDFLDEDSSPGDVNLLVDAVRFGSLERLRTVLGQGAEPRAATADVADALAQRRGGDGDSAYWACAVLGYAAGLLPGELIPGTWMRPTSLSAPPADDGSTQAGSPGEPFDRSRTQPSPAPAGGAAEQPPVDTVDSSGSASDRGRGALWLRLALAAVLVLVVAAVVVFLTRQGDTSDRAEGNIVPVADIVPAFGHFGPNGGLAKALKTCGVATVPGEDYESYNCSFVDKHGPFDLELTEKNAEIRNSTELPGIVRRPPANTIVTTQEGQDTYHAYYLEFVGSGEDRTKNTPDDEVTLTLFDVDPTHPGAAVFSAKDKDSTPLTRETADRLLQAIGASDEVFPLPEEFRIASLELFAQPFRSTHADVDCAPAFSTLNGELEHDVCRDGDVSVAFGLVLSRNLDKAAYKYRTDTGDTYTWAGASGSGQLITSTYRDSTRLYWDNGSQAYGVLTAKTADRDARALRDYFADFMGDPKVTRSAS